MQNNQAKAGELEEELDRVQYNLDVGKQEIQNINKQVHSLDYWPYL